MKRIVFGVALMICCTIGILTLFLFAVIAEQSLGSINGNSSIFTYLDWYGLTKFFYIFAASGIAGIVVCVAEAYFSKDSK